MKQSKQSGAALVISLIMLTAVTFLAVISLQNSSTQIKMVSNTQMREAVFQSSMSELQAKYDFIAADSEGTDMLTGAMSSVTDSSYGQTIAEYIPIEFEVSSTGQQNISTAGAILYKGIGNNLNYALTQGSSVGKFVEHPFEITAIANESNNFFISSQTEGITFLSGSGR